MIIYTPILGFGYRLLGICNSYTLCKPSTLVIGEWWWTLQIVELLIFSNGHFSNTLIKLDRKSRWYYAGCYVVRTIRTIHGTRNWKIILIWCSSFCSVYQSFEFTIVHFTEIENLNVKSFIYLLDTHEIINYNIWFRQYMLSGNGSSYPGTIKYFLRSRQASITLFCIDVHLFLLRIQEPLHLSEIEYETITASKLQ